LSYVWQVPISASRISSAFAAAPSAFVVVLTPTAFPFSEASIPALICTVG
jgi:hypothetical protein